MKPRSIMDGDLGFTLYQTEDGMFAIDLTTVAGVVVDEPTPVYASASKRDAYAVFRALNAGMVSAIESAGELAALRMADDMDSEPAGDAYPMTPRERPGDVWTPALTDDGTDVMSNGFGEPVDSAGRTWADVNGSPGSSYGWSYLTSEGYRDDMRRLDALIFVTGLPDDEYPQLPR